MLAMFFSPQDVLILIAGLGVIAAVILAAIYYFRGGPRG